MAFNRTVNVPAPFFGIRPGFNIADLPMSNTVALQVITDATTTTTSDPVLNFARSIDIGVTFAAANTTCDVVVKDSTSTVVWTQIGVAFGLGQDFNVGGFEHVDLAGLPYTITVQNIQNASKINVFVKKTS